VEEAIPMRTALSFAVGLTLTLAASSAFAQEDGTVSGTGTVEVSGEESLPPPPPPVVTEPAAPAAPVVVPAAVAPEADDGLTDHERVVGKFAVGYLGLTSLPIGDGGVTAVTQGSLSTPVIGVRYWFAEAIGLDLGLGFALGTGSRQVEQNNVTTTIDLPAAMGFALHAGVPIAFAHAKHYKFLVIPELNVGLTTRTVRAQGIPPGAPVPPDVHHSGFRLDVGGRIGSEVHFGFIGVPQLSLQATVGLAFNHLAWRNSQDAGPGVASPQASSVTATGIGTTVQSDPWALFVNNISALYYFP
jgi:hypothetical protein